MTVYIVQKLHWEYNDTFYIHIDDEPLKAFVSRQDAEEYRRTLERKHVVSPLRKLFSGRFIADRFGEDEYGGTKFIGVQGQMEKPEALYEVIEAEIET